MKQFSVYCRPVELNEVTRHYISVITRALEANGFKSAGVQFEPKAAAKSDLVLTISALSAFLILMRCPRTKLVHWFQGLESVERRYLHRGLSAWARWAVWTALENIVLRFCSFKLYVSEEMADWYEKPAKKKQNYYIMPCYNVTIADYDTCRGIYNTASRRTDVAGPGLVYAGSMFEWQCVGEALDLFKYVKSKCHAATLTIFTGEVDRAKEICNSRKLGWVEVRSANANELLEALASYDFGLILRRHQDLNFVSTPTKLGTYMASGVVPVVTKATPALVRMLESYDFKIVGEDAEDLQNIGDSIISLWNQEALKKTIHAEYERIFQTQFCDDLHIANMAAAMRIYL